jgi:hypothetical protein
MMSHTSRPLSVVDAQGAAAAIQRDAITLVLPGRGVMDRDFGALQA